VITLDELAVKDVMSTEPLCLNRETAVAEALQTLVGHDLQGAPVVDDEGDLIGVVSTTDLLAAMAPAFKPGDPVDVRSLHELKNQRVGTLCERPPVRCGEDIAVGELCQLMIREHVHRVVVTRGAHPIGIVSAIDLVRIVACMAAHDEPRD
jgi:CBS domain-containing protein